MPKVNHENLGEVLKYRYKVGTILGIYYNTEENSEHNRDHANVRTEDGMTGFIPIHYHCDAVSSWTERGNGSIIGGSAGFNVGDQVIIRTRINDTGGEDLFQIVGHTAGPRKCRCCTGTFEEGSVTSLPREVTNMVACEDLEALRLGLVERAVSVGISSEILDDSIAPYLQKASTPAWFILFDNLLNLTIPWFYLVSYSNDGSVSSIDAGTVALFLERIGDTELLGSPTCETMAAWVNQRLKIIRAMEFSKVVLAGKEYYNSSKVNRHLQHEWAKKGVTSQFHGWQDRHYWNECSYNTVRENTVLYSREDYSPAVGKAYMNQDLILNSSNNNYLPGLPSMLQSYKIHSFLGTIEGSWGYAHTHWYYELNVDRKKVYERHWPYLDININAVLPGLFHVYALTGVYTSPDEDYSFENWTLPEEQYVIAHSQSISAGENSISTEIVKLRMPEPAAPGGETIENTEFRYSTGYNSLPVSYFGLIQYDFQFQ